MFSLFRKSQSSSAIPEALYGTLMTKARDPQFFTGFGVPDSVMGRFDMLSLHVYLFSRRMRLEGGDLAMSLSQDVFDLFTADVERALRQLGIGDQTVPKRKKKMIRSFYGQIDDFDPAFADADAALLAEKVDSRFFTGNNEVNDGPNVNPIEGTRPNALADYMIACDKALAVQSFADICSGKLYLPEIALSQ